MDASGIERRVRAAGLLPAGGPVVVLLSGGADSVCLLDLAARICSPVTALHVNYGLRDTAAADARLCAGLCERLGVELMVARPDAPPSGNLQAWAREQRYAQAERLARERGAVVAAGHTATDQVETVLYRLAASPGRRALLGMRARDGLLVRPLLELTRADTRAYCEQRGLTWADDPTNASPRFARNRVRHGLLEALREVHPAAEQNVLRTLALLRDEAAVLDAVVDDALRAAGDPPTTAALAALPPALQRLCLQRLAGRAVGSRTEEILGLGAGGGTRSLDLGGGLRAVVEYGALRFERGDLFPLSGNKSPTALSVPGRTAFAGGEVVCDVGEGPLDAAALAAPLEVRAWRPGDRMRPLGLGGSRSLQDLFTDRKIPRARRTRIPVVVSRGEIAWVPGVATGERFGVTPATRRAARLTWHSPYD